ncbi:MAG: hypothetical protein KKC85_16825 [Gammaproteobacteria bacterium]|nr:hypothetical protein [Gammaproteobacteria bacterium]
MPGVAREEILDLGRTGFLQAGLEFPVGGPGFERMALGQWEQGAQACLVAALEGLLHLDHHVVIRALRPGGLHADGGGDRDE